MVPVTTKQYILLFPKSQAFQVTAARFPFENRDPFPHLHWKAGTSIYHLVMTNIAMENPNHKWKIPYKNGGINGKIIYFYGPFSMAMLNNRRVYIYICMFPFSTV